VGHEQASRAFESLHGELLLVHIRPARPPSRRIKGPVSPYVISLGTTFEGVRTAENRRAIFAVQIEATISGAS
jgi:hypothetical protein